MITLTNGHVQNAASIFVPYGSISFALNVDATVVLSPGGFVCADIPVVFQLDGSGNLIQPCKIFSNEELNPQNSVGLGTYYLVTVRDQNGASLSEPMAWQFNQIANSTVDISTMTPFFTEGNVIFYPTAFPIGTPGPATLGGIFSNVGSAHQWVSAIGIDGTVTLSQPAFTDISGTLTNAQLPTPITFTSITASGLITAQANLELGVVGTTSGQITLDGSTSGQAMITAPAVAGTITNPVLFSNTVTLAATCVLTASIVKGGFQDSVQTASGSTDALTFPGAVFITTAGVDATTLATPTAGTDDGKKIIVFDAGGHAHTITTAASKIVPAHHLATFGGTAGSWVEFEAFNGLWYPKANAGVTIA